MSGHGWNPAVSGNDPYPTDVTDDYEGPWDIYSYGKIRSHGQQCLVSSDGYKRCSSCNPDSGSDDEECNQDYCFCWDDDPNENCPYAYIQPMISDKAMLDALIDTMDDHGYTYSNIVGEQEERFLEVCDLLKKSVMVYTVTFEHAFTTIDDETKQIYKDCATQP